MDGRIETAMSGGSFETTFHQANGAMLFRSFLSTVEMSITLVGGVAYKVRERSICIVSTLMIRFILFFNRSENIKALYRKEIVKLQSNLFLH